MKRLFNLKNLFASFLVFGFLVLSSNYVFAATCNPNQVGLSNMGIDLLSDPTGSSCPDLTVDGTSKNLIADDLAAKVNVVVKLLLGFTASIGLVAFVYAGVIILLSKGDQKAFAKGTSILKYTFGGILIIIFSYAITNFLTTTVPKMTGGTTSSSSNSNCAVNNSNIPSSNYLSSVPSSSIINGVNPGDGCGGASGSAQQPGKCMYLLDSYVQSSAYPVCANLNSASCGVNVGKSGTINGKLYDLRCVSN